MTRAMRITGGGTAAEHLRLRLRLNRLLNTAVWRPPGMPPTAVLIVRHLHDPLPGKLAAEPNAIRAPTAWETAVQQQMAALYRRAARPSRGQLPPSASAAAAILFADEAEMLAILALDAARGLAGDRWWWQALRRARPGLPWREPAHLLLDQPRLIPAIVTYLHVWGVVEVVTAVLSTEQAMGVLTAVGHTFHLPPLPTPHSPRPTRHSPLASHHAPAPWESFLPPTAVPATRSPAHTCLLGLSLSLNYRPAAVSTPSFTRQLQSWWQAQTRPPSPTEPDYTLTPSPSQTDPAPAETAVPPNVSPEQAVTRERLSSAPSAVQPPDPSPLEATPTDHRLPITDNRSPTTEPPPPIEKHTAVPAPASPSPVPEITETAVFPENGIPTQLGGIFYLVNVMDRLDIPASYEETWHLASQVGAWGTLELLARGLLAPMPPHLQADPIWTALAELDGRAPNQPLATRHSPLITRIRTYLLTALRLDDPDLLAETLLLVNGRLHISNTHVDLVMPLEAVSLPVRLAGLDFDPGWQPAFGRVIQFHFQS